MVTSQSLDYNERAKAIIENATLTEEGVLSALRTLGYGREYFEFMPRNEQGLVHVHRKVREGTSGYEPNSSFSIDDDGKVKILQLDQLADAGGRNYYPGNRALEMLRRLNQGFVLVHNKAGEDEVLRGNKETGRKMFFTTLYYDLPGGVGKVMPVEVLVGYLEPCKGSEDRPAEGLYFRSRQSAVVDNVIEEDHLLPQVKAPRELLQRSDGLELKSSVAHLVRLFD